VLPNQRELEGYTVRLAIAWTQRMAQDLLKAWREGGRFGRLAVATLAVCLALPLVAVAGLGLGLGLATAEPLHGLPVPSDQLQAINRASLSCTALTPARLAAQIMAASGFDPQASPGGGRAGVAGLTDAMWEKWAPAPDASRDDVEANILALAHADCDLVGQVRAAGMPGEPWQLALAGFHSGLDAVTTARGIPDDAAGYVDVVAAYAEWYAQSPQFGGASTANLVPSAEPNLLAPPAEGLGGPPVPVPDAYVADVVAAGKTCPAVTAPRIAAQVMAMSAFNPNAMGSDGAMGIAAFRPETWAEFNQSAPGTVWDPAAAIRALAATMCELTEQMSGLGSDPYLVALAAFQLGTPATRQAGASRAMASVASFIRAVTEYTTFYAADPRLNAIPLQPTTPSTPSRPSGEPPAAPADGWRLTWSDEFTGAAGTAPDATKWARDIGGEGWGNAELQYFTDSPENSALNGSGHLAITARAGGASGQSCWYGACTHTSGRVTTKNHFTQAYGRISARIKLPRGQGIWPSFTALGENISTVGWPASGELNVFNSLGSKPATVQSGLAGPDYSKWATTTLSSGTFADDYHTFSADWYPDHISFFVDGRLYHSQYRVSAGAGWVFDKPFFLVLDISIGGNLPGNPDATTTFPQQMLVDWVRVYQAGPPAAAATGPITGLAGKCIEAADASSGSPVRLDQCDSSSTQSWTLGTDGTVQAMGRCLSVTDSGTANGTKIQLLDCAGTPAQVWQAQTNGQLVNPHSGKCLDVTQNSSENGTPLQIWECWGASNQRWNLP
jgi:beta-glucanase (GH16 family)